MRIRLQKSSKSPFIVLCHIFNIKGKNAPLAGIKPVTFRSLVNRKYRGKATLPTAHFLFLVCTNFGNSGQKICVCNCTRKINAISSYRIFLRLLNFVIVKSAALKDLYKIYTKTCKHKVLYQNNKKSIKELHLGF